MAFLLVNPDGTSNAQAGDYVVTGGGIFQKLADGTSKLVDKLPTASGKTTSYDEVKRIFSSIQNATAAGSKVSAPGQDIAQGIQDIQVLDNAWNYDDYGVGNDYYQDYSLGSGSLKGSSIVGYVVVALVGIVVVDRLMR